MLVLNRRRNERVVVETADGELWIKFVGYNQQGHAKFLFDGPKSIRVWREEVYLLRKRKELEDAASQQVNYGEARQENGSGGIGLGAGG